MNGSNPELRAGACLLALTFLFLSLADSSWAQTQEDLRLRAPGTVDRVVACDNSERGVIATENVIAETTAMTSEEGFVVGNANFTPNGEILIVDDGLNEVWLADRDLNRIRRIGRAGSGPGEYVQPTDAAQGEDGRIYVLDRTRGTPLRGCH